jgi:hypothetical protein
MIIDELEKAGHLPSTWHHLTKDHITHLVTWWRKAGFSISTMINRLSVFRHFSQFIGAMVVFPDNQTVGLIKYSPTNKYSAPINQEYLKNIENPLIKIIGMFQMNFGLTKKEIMRLIAKYHFFENKIYVSRQIAFNHQERFIPVLTEDQIIAVQLWQQQIPDNQCLLDLYTYDTLIQMYGHEMQQQGGKIFRYRSFYARSRYAALIPYHTRRAVLNLLQQEMGISHSQIRRYLREQE